MNFSEINNILITGGFGQLGNFLLNLITEVYPDINILVVDDLSNSYNYQNFLTDENNLSFINSKIQNDRLYNEKLLEFDKIDAVIHCAAQISINKSISNPLLDAQVNILGTLKLLDWAKNLDIKNFLTVGSAATLGETQEIPVTTKQQRRPISPYGFSKFSAEWYTEFYRKNWSLNYKVLRPYNMYSQLITPTDGYGNVISNFINDAISGNPFKIEGDGTQTRDFIYASDVAKLCIKALEDESQSIFNAATGNRTSIIELSRIVADVIGVEWQVEYIAQRKGDIKYSLGERSKLFNFEPIGLYEGIKRIKEYLIINS